MLEDSSNIFSIMPMNQRFLLVPGETYEGKVMVVNPADAVQDFAYKADVTPYSVEGESYAADLATLKNQSEIVKWITIENPTGVVKPNEVAEVNYKITVPENAAGGGQYAAIVIGSDKDVQASESVTVSNVFEMASIIYAQVEGEINHDGKILDHHVPGFVTKSPITATTQVNNNGNSHEDVKIITRVTNFINGEVLLPSDDNTGEYSEVIMPETERIIIQDIDTVPALGVVNVEQTLYYMGTSQIHNSVVIICPIWFMALVLVTITAIIAIIIRIIVKHRRKKADLMV